MNNPWKDLYSQKDDNYILDADRKFIIDYNNKLKNMGNKKYEIVNQLPGPYVGNPCKATVIILSLNPGYNPGDDDLHKRPGFRADHKKNLLHEDMDYPFYYLNDIHKIDKDGKKGGYGYWCNGFLRDIISKIGDVKLVSQKMCLIEWFPYHSAKYDRSCKFNETLKGTESHKYSVHLAKSAMKNEKILIVHRALKPWKEVLGFNKDDIITYKKGYPIRSWHLKKENLKDGDFNKICNAIRNG